MFKGFGGSKKGHGKRGKQQQYSDETIEFCVTLKVLLGLLRQQSRKMTLLPDIGV